MGLTIKDREAIALAEEVAELAGTSKTAAIVEALRRYREELTRARDAQSEARKREMMAILERAWAVTDKLAPFSDEDLYDEFGLPR